LLTFELSVNKGFKEIAFPAIRYGHLWFPYRTGDIDCINCIEKIWTHIHAYYYLLFFSCGCRHLSGASRL